MSTQVSEAVTASNGPARTESGGSLAASPARPPVEFGAHGLELRTLADAWRFAQYIVESRMAPKSFTTPAQVLVAIQMGAENGMLPMQSLRHIAVINGIPSIYGNAVGASIRKSPSCKSLGQPVYTGAGETRLCTIKAERTNGDKAECSFGYADAKRAGLLSKDSYRSYPDRMYYRRALGYIRDELFPDVFLGLPLVEEVQDRIVDQPSITSGDDAPLESLDQAADLIAMDDDRVQEAEFEPHPSAPTAEELADWEREKSAAAGQTSIPF